MTTLRQAAQQALEALEQRDNATLWHQAIHALRDALAQEEQEQEPVLTMNKMGSLVECSPTVRAFDLSDGEYKLYTHPPRREWQSLSEEENNELSLTMVKGHKSVNWLSRAIERALKEKNQ